MKRFREFLAEGIETDYSELFGGYLIPFSEKMWQRITGEQYHTMYGIHVTDAKGAHTLFKSVVGRKKSLMASANHFSESICAMFLMHLVS